VTGLELFLLGRTLMKLGEESIHRAGFNELPTSVRSVLVDVFEHPSTSIREIAARTGFPQSLVSASVARLREGGALVTAVDPVDRRRTLVTPAPELVGVTAGLAPVPIDGAVGVALRTDDPAEVAEVVLALETLARRLSPDALERLRA